MSTPYVATEYPKNTKDYKEFEVDGIKVFIDKYAKAKNKYINITLLNMLIFKSIEVHGLDLT